MSTNSLLEHRIRGFRALQAGTDVIRSMAERADATITEVDASHVVMVSHPDVVADVIRTAAAATGAGA